VGSVVVVEGWPCVLAWGLVDEVAAAGERRGEERGHRGVSTSHREAATAMRVGGSEVKVGKWLRHEQAAKVTTVMRVMRQVAAAADEWAQDTDARAWDADTRARGADTRAWDAGMRARDADTQARLASYPVPRVGAATRHQWVTEVRVDRVAWASSRRAGKGMPMRGCELMVVGGVRLSLLAWGQGVEAAVREEMQEVEGHCEVPQA
jgi:hypothetical protein